MKKQTSFQLFWYYFLFSNYVFNRFVFAFSSQNIKVWPKSWKLSINLPFKNVKIIKETNSTCWHESANFCDSKSNRTRRWCHFRRNRKIEQHVWEYFIRFLYFLGYRKWNMYGTCWHTFVKLPSHFANWVFLVYNQFHSFVYVRNYAVSAYFVVRKLFLRAVFYTAVYRFYFNV